MNVGGVFSEKIKIEFILWGIYINPGSALFYLCLSKFTWLHFETLIACCQVMLYRIFLITLYELNQRRGQGMTQCHSLTAIFIQGGWY